MARQPCMMRGGCGKYAEFECILEATGRTVFRCEEHAKRQYFMSSDVSISRIDDANDEPTPPRDTVDFVSVEDFGKDHWSLLAYVETRCVDEKGILNGMHLRINGLRHPEPLWERKRSFLESAWSTEAGTRLNDYFLRNGKVDNTRKLPDHDDIDCLADFVKEGFITIDEKKRSVKLTNKGLKTVQNLRIHKINGGMYGNFDYKKEYKL